MDKRKLKLMIIANNVFRRINRVIFLIYLIVPISMLLGEVLWNILVRTGVISSENFIIKAVQFPGNFVYEYCISGYPYNHMPLFPFICAFQIMLLIAEISTEVTVKRRAYISVLLFVADIIIFGISAFFQALAAGMSI